MSSTELNLTGLIKLGSTMRSLGVQLTPENYVKALHAWGFSAPQGFLHIFNQEFYESLDKEPMVTSVPQNVQNVQVKASKPVAVAPTPELDASDLFDL
jgi:hypothetical protein